MTRTLKHSGIRRRFWSRYFYRSGQPMTGYGAVRLREITFDECKRARGSYFCTACGDPLPPNHLVDRNGQTTRLHLDCGDAV